VRFTNWTPFSGAEAEGFSSESYAVLISDVIGELQELRELQLGSSDEARFEVHASPKWLRNWPFAGIVLKEWYPVYLRVTGIGGFVFALVWLTLLIRLFSK